MGGGYGTGRELVEFFMPHGPVYGLLGMAVAASIWSIVLAVSFEFARITQSYDYRTFFKNLLGPFWFLFEIAFVLLVLIILSVLGAASGEFAHELLNVPPIVGTITLLLLIVVLVFYGTQLVEIVFSTWSLLLYVIFFTFLIATSLSFGDEIANAFTAKHNPASSDVPSWKWALDGLRYAGYNMAVIPALLFLVRHFENRRDAIAGGLIAGLIGILPAVFFFVSMIAFYPEILSAPVPSQFVLEKLNIIMLSLVFQVMLFGTFVETGAGLIHGVNERIATAFGVSEKRTLPLWVRPAVAIILTTLATTAAVKIGLIDLIANGYGVITYLIIAIYIAPVLTLGVWKIITKGENLTSVAGNKPMSPLDG